MTLFVAILSDLHAVGLILFLILAAIFAITTAWRSAAKKSEKAKRKIELAQKKQERLCNLGQHVFIYSEPDLKYEKADACQAIIPKVCIACGYRPADDVIKTTIHEWGKPDPESQTRTCTRCREKQKWAWCDNCNGNGEVLEGRACGQCQGEGGAYC